MTEDKEKELDQLMVAMYYKWPRIKSKVDRLLQSYHRNGVSMASPTSMVRVRQLYEVMHLFLKRE